jgi:hypothetical protein
VMDESTREQLLDQLAGLEDELAHVRAEMAAKPSGPVGQAPSI